MTGPEIVAPTRLEPVGYQIPFPEAKGALVCGKTFSVVGTKESWGMAAFADHAYASRYSSELLIRSK